MGNGTSTATATAPHSVAPKEAERFEDLERKLREQGRPVDGPMLRRAFEVAARQHRGQRRKTGEPYLSHPLEVAHILADLRLDTQTLVGGLLHDTIEDTSATLERIESDFGPEIARCVDGVTKIGRIRFQSQEAQRAGTYRKMLLAMTRDIRVILIKLADRLHNMRTLHGLDADRQRRIALETREIYAPVALRLGMGKVRSELEDLAFSYLEPHAYRTIVDQIDQRREATEEFLGDIQRELAGKLRQAGIPSRLQGRIKRPYSIYQKLNRQNVSFDMVYDLLALRVITDSKTHCYAAMGVIHGQWHPVPSRIRDFVAMPRPNLYQSLHTTVVTRGGQRFEVQIRTEEMHRMAEEGICAHWKYKEGGDESDGSVRQMAWLRRMVEWQREVSDSTEFLSTLKIELYPEDVYVFTPRGKVITLPSGATPVDFAYAIHTEVGHTCVGAKVDGQIAPLKRPLETGQIVEVITASGRHPSQDWLSFVKTSRARHKIKQWLNAQRRGEAIEIGRKLLEKEARSHGVSLKRIEPGKLEEVCREYGCSTMDDLHSRLGFGRFSPTSVLRKMAPDGSAFQRTPPARGRGAGTPVARPAAGADDTLTVSGMDDILTYRARCCNPLPGEQIVGYVTRGKGVAVHSTTCRNVQNLMFETDRRIDVRWDPKEDSRYRAKVTVVVGDSRGVLKDLTSVITNLGLNIVEVKSRSSRDYGRARVSFVVEVADMRQLETVASALGRMDAVRDVHRSQRI